jgi:hypothetical protein
MELGLKFIELQRIFPKACLGYPVTLTEGITQRKLEEADRGWTWSKTRLHFGSFILVGYFPDNFEHYFWIWIGLHLGCLSIFSFNI